MRDRAEIVLHLMGPGVSYTLIYLRCFRKNMIIRNGIHAPSNECKFPKKKNVRRGGQNARQQRSTAWVQQPEENVVDRNFMEMSTDSQSEASPEMQTNKEGGSSSLIQCADTFVPTNNSQQKRARAEEARAEEEL